MCRTMFLVTLLILVTGCARILEPLPGFEKLVSGVIVSGSQEQVKVEAAWTVSNEAIRNKAKEGCQHQSANKMPTKQISSICGSILCLTTVHTFYCKTKEEMDKLEPKTREALQYH